MNNSAENFASSERELTVEDKLRLLLDITSTISRSLDLDEVLRLVMDTLGLILHYDAAGIYIIECYEDEGRGTRDCTFRTEAIRGYEIGELVDPELRLGEGFIGRVAVSGEPILSGNVHADERYFSARARTKSEMVVPIISSGEIVGVFDLESDRENAYDTDDLSVLQLLASQVAIIIEKVMLHEHLAEKQRLQGQLEVARQVQLELLPASDPHLSGFDISGYNYPSEEVSGDYYDWVKFLDDQLGIVIADASGKGIPAALLMAFLRASLRSAAHTGYAPHIAMTKVNFLLWESTERNQFVTAVYGILDSVNKVFVYSNAGHNPLLHLRKNGEARFMDFGDLPLGMFENTNYHQHFLKLEAGDILAFYTDGITEATNHDGKEFGTNRLAYTIEENRHKSAREIIEAVYRQVSDFAENFDLGDDGTLFIVKTL